tara:strand:+ start:4774 stop:7503 length:2730 start_codon:yes stop_codon:yes gene_type:complete
MKTAEPPLVLDEASERLPGLKLNDLGRSSTPDFFLLNMGDDAVGVLEVETRLDVYDSYRTLVDVIGVMDYDMSGFEVSSYVRSTTSVENGRQRRETVISYRKEHGSLEAAMLDYEAEVVIDRDPKRSNTIVERVVEIKEAVKAFVSYSGLHFKVSREIEEVGKVQPMMDVSNNNKVTQLKIFVVIDDEPVVFDIRTIYNDGKIRESVDVEVPHAEQDQHMWYVERINALYNGNYNGVIVPRTVYYNYNSVLASLKISTFRRVAVFDRDTALTVMPLKKGLVAIGPKVDGKHVWLYITMSGGSIYVLMHQKISKSKWTLLYVHEAEDVVDGARMSTHVIEGELVETEEGMVIYVFDKASHIESFSERRREIVMGLDLLTALLGTNYMTEKEGKFMTWYLQYVPITIKMAKFKTLTSDNFYQEALMYYDVVVNQLGLPTDGLILNDLRNRNVYKVKLQYIDEDTVISHYSIDLYVSVKEFMVYSDVNSMFIPVNIRNAKITNIKKAHKAAIQKGYLGKVVEYKIQVYDKRKVRILFKTIREMKWIPNSQHVVRSEITSAIYTDLKTVFRANWKTFAYYLNLIKRTMIQTVTNDAVIVDFGAGDGNVTSGSKNNFKILIDPIYSNIPALLEQSEYVVLGGFEGEYTQVDYEVPDAIPSGLIVADKKRDASKPEDQKVYWYDAVNMHLETMVKKNINIDIVHFTVFFVMSRIHQSDLETFAEEVAQIKNVQYVSIMMIDGAKMIPVKSEEVITEAVTKFLYENGRIFMASEETLEEETAELTADKFDYERTDLTGIYHEPNDTVYENISMRFVLNDLVDEDGNIQYTNVVKKEHHGATITFTFEGSRTTQNQIGYIHWPREFYSLLGYAISKKRKSNIGVNQFNGTGRFITYTHLSDDEQPYARCVSIMQITV